MSRAASFGSRLVCLVALGVLANLSGVRAASGRSTLKSALVYYTGAQGPGAQVNALVAQRYAAGITGLEIAQNAVEIKRLNPAFAWHVYNSLSDNYQDSEENQLLASAAAAHGVNVEACFLHYYDDTRITLQGQSVFIPGWGGGSATTMAEARVPIYYADLSRRITHFGTPVARQIQKEVMLALSVDRTFDGTSLHPDGIFLDNAGHVLCNFGEIQQGGHVLEAPDHALIGNPQFQTWFWEGAEGPFLTALKDTLETSAAWTQDHRRKHLMINVANFWTDSYVSRDVADILFLEFQYDPVRNPDPDAVLTAWKRDVLAASAGIRSFYAPAMRRSAAPCPGEISYGQALLGSLAWYLTTRTEESLLFLYGKGDPGAAGWDSLTWRRCVEVAQSQLGFAQGDPYVIAEGRDPTGKAYRIWARTYDHGLVLVRNRGRWDEGIEPATAVAVPLPHPLAPVRPEGEIGGAVSTISLRNGTGAILLGDPGPPPLHRTR
jgi:hypothetical protein